MFNITEAIDCEIERFSLLVFVLLA